MNIPNILTVSRIFLVPVFIIFLLEGLFFEAILIFAYAGISDALDGFIARYFNQQTTIGAYLDPVADKLLITSSFICLALLKIIPGWVTIIVISRDIWIITGIFILSILNAKFVIKPSFVSKCTTMLELTTVLATLFHVVLPQNKILIHLLPFLYFATVIFCILSGFHYTYKGMNILQASTDENPSQDKKKPKNRI